MTESFRESDGRDLNSVDRFPCWFTTPRLSRSKLHRWESAS